MCGILGEITNTLTPLQVFEGCLNASRHRGPDSQSTWADDVHCRMGFNRLSILDLSENGMQPLHSPSGRYVLVFNGEIYNYRELQRQNAIPQEVLRSTSDSEVIAQLLDHLSFAELVAQLNGMFALCVYDSVEKNAWLARDFAGIKPLFYGINQNAFVFASQFDQVFKHPAFRDNLKLRPDMMKEYFGLGYMPAPNTVFEDIFQVEPGQYITYSLSERKIIVRERYFDWDSRDVFPETAEQTVPSLNTVFAEVVRDQLNADVPLATFLSGGIDSPLVTAHAAAHKGDLQAFTISVNDSSTNEAAIAARYAASMGVSHSIENFDEQELLDVVDEHFQAMPEPMGDYSSLPSYLITKKAKAHATVMLSGDGGDELFWGYPRFLAQVSHARYFRWPLWIRKPIVRAFRRISGKHITAALDHLGTFTDWTFNFQIYFFKEHLDALVPGTHISQETQALYTYNGSLKDKTALLRWLKKNEFYGHLQRVLRKVDLTSMANSLEVRVPFLDKRVIEFSNQVIPELSIKHTNLKYILKKALARFVPENLIFQEKRGFGVPLADYLRKDLRGDLIQTCLEGDIYGSDHLNVTFFRQYVQDFLDNRHDNAWGVWHLYAWQKWARFHLAD